MVTEVRCYRIVPKLLKKMFGSGGKYMNRDSKAKKAKVVVPQEKRLQKWKKSKTFAIRSRTPQPPSDGTHLHFPFLKIQ